MITDKKKRDVSVVSDTAPRISPVIPVIIFLDKKNQ